MSWTPEIAMAAPNVTVRTTSERGLTPDELADLAMDKLISVSDSAPPVIADQARAFKARMREVVLHYMKQAIASDRTTLYNTLKQAGHPDLAEMIRRI